VSSVAWLISAGGSCAIVAASTPLLRRFALAKGVVDHPGGHKSHSVPVPYLGGLAIMAGAVVAQVAVGGGVPNRTAAILIAAVMLGLVGVVDDRRNLHPLPRLAAQVLAAAAAIAAGVRVNITGNPVVDSLATVVWIVAMTNAINFLDNMDGLASGLCAVSAASAFVLASAAGQRVVATAASALVGACLGFLVYNRPPARIYMGDGGSLFLGFLLAIVANEVDPAQAPPRSWIVPALLLALPVLDTTTVMLGRWRNGKTLYLGGRDHLSHRLVARGWSKTDAVLTLIGCQALFGFLAIFAGRSWLALWATVAAAVPVLLGLIILTLKPDVHGRHAAQRDQREQENQHLQALPHDDPEVPSRQRQR
jgi:UDP-GlcNAc:undecaprenyl-phosphate GlcNAc-1-phosphate transferase